MSKLRDLALTASAPAIWGSSYIVTTTTLPDHDPLLVALLRALPAGLLLLLIVRQLPPISMMPKLLILGALNFSVFWSLLFLSAYRLPGGIAATLGAVQPLFVLGLSTLVLGSSLHWRAILAAVMSLAGVAMLVLSPAAALDGIGVAAGLGGALSMAAGVVLTRKWQPKVPALTFTAWQLSAGGLMLVPILAGGSLLTSPDLPLNGGRGVLEMIRELTPLNLLGLSYMSLVGGALTYVIWFRGIARLSPASVSILGVFSPLSAVALGSVFLGEGLTPLQCLGAAITLASVWLAQRNGSLVSPSAARSAQPT